jgi:hypothetical protein
VYTVGYFIWVLRLLLQGLCAERAKSANLSGHSKLQNVFTLLSLLANAEGIFVFMLRVFSEGV